MIEMMTMRAKIAMIEYSCVIVGLATSFFSTFSSFTAILSRAARSRAQ